MPDWLDNLAEQISQSVAGGDSPADAIPSEDMSKGSSEWNPGRDSQAAADFFSTFFGGKDGSPDTQQMGASQAAYVPWEDGFQGSSVLTDPNPPEKATFLQGLMKNIGLKKTSDGTIDYSDPKTIDALMKLVMGGASITNALMNRGVPQNYKSAAQLQQEIKSPFSNWTPQQQAAMNAFTAKPMGSNRNMIYASQMPSPIVPGKGYADGGSVLTPFSSASPSYAAYGGTPGGTYGATGALGAAMQPMSSPIQNSIPVNTMGGGAQTWFPPNTSSPNLNIGGGSGAAAIGMGGNGHDGAPISGLYQGAMPPMGAPNSSLPAFLGGAPGSNGVHAPIDPTTGGINGVWGDQGWMPGQSSQGHFIDPSNLPNVVNGVQMSPGMGDGFLQTPGAKGTIPGSSGYDAQMIYAMKADPNAAAGTPFASYLHGGNGNGPVGFDRGGAMLAMRAMNAGLDPANFMGVGGHGQLARALMTPNVANAGQARQSPHVDMGGGGGQDTFTPQGPQGQPRFLGGPTMAPGSSASHETLNPAAHGPQMGINSAPRGALAVAHRGMGKMQGNSPPIMPVNTVQMAHGGALGHVMSSGGGQDDSVPAKLSGGEYVFDADSVSALGDGNNAAGAQKLDAMRENLRAHKRSAPASKIPPKAKAPEAYMKGAK